MVQLGARQPFLLQRLQLTVRIPFRIGEPQNIARLGLAARRHEILVERLVWRAGSCWRGIGLERWRNNLLWQSPAISRSRLPVLSSRTPTPTYCRTKGSRFPNATSRQLFIRVFALRLAREILWIYAWCRHSTDVLARAAHLVTLIHPQPTIGVNVFIFFVENLN